jgi:hypothetical protein
MRKLIYSVLIPILALIGPLACMGPNNAKPTTQTVEYGVIKTFDDAVSVLNAAYLFGTYSKVQHDAIKPFVNGAYDALDRYNADVKRGDMIAAQRDIDAFNVFANRVLNEAATVQKGQK